MSSVFLTETTVLVKLKPVRSVSFILGSSVVALLTFGAGKRHDIPHDKFLASPLPQGKRGLLQI